MGFGDPQPQAFAFFAVNSWCGRVFRCADVEVIFFFYCGNMSMG